jgi:hypothetical protein
VLAELSIHASHGLPFTSVKTLQKAATTHSEVIGPRFGLSLTIAEFRDAFGDALDDPIRQSRKTLLLGLWKGDSNNVDRNGGDSRASKWARTAKVAEE